MQLALSLFVQGTVAVHSSSLPLKLKAPLSTPRPQSASRPAPTSSLSVRQRLAPTPPPCLALMFIKAYFPRFSRIGVLDARRLCRPDTGCDRDEAFAVLQISDTNRYAKVGKAKDCDEMSCESGERDDCANYRAFRLPILSKLLYGSRFSG
jgi:hypothetical protein